MFPIHVIIECETVILIGFERPSYNDCFISFFSSTCFNIDVRTYQFKGRDRDNDNNDDGDDNQDGQCSA